MANCILLTIVLLFMGLSLTDCNIRSNRTIREQTPQSGNCWDPANMGPSMKALYASLQPVFQKEPALPSFLLKRSAEFHDLSNMRDYDIKSLMKQYKEYKAEFEMRERQNATMQGRGTQGVNEQNVAESAAFGIPKSNTASGASVGRNDGKAERDSEPAPAEQAAQGGGHPAGGGAPEKGAVGPNSEMPSTNQQPEEHPEEESPPEQNPASITSTPQPNPQMQTQPGA